MPLNPEFLNYLMEEALVEARRAFDLAEVPIGAVIAKGDEIIARAHNEIETLRDVTAHAEILAIRRASKALNNWRLNDCLICVTLEPCTMCIGAIKLSRLSVLAYGAPDPRYGATDSVVSLGSNPSLGTVPTVVSGVMKEESSKLLKDFFSALREKRE